jgi:hypothetical protein
MQLRDITTFVPADTFVLEPGSFEFDPTQLLALLTDEETRTIRLVFNATPVDVVLHPGTPKMKFYEMKNNILRASAPQALSGKIVELRPVEKIQEKQDRHKRRPLLEEGRVANLSATMDGIEKQNAEFDALDVLIICYQRMMRVAVVDDDYPEVRHQYETAMKVFIVAAANNGRIWKREEPKPGA